MPGFVPPRWSKPAPLGYGHAADAAHFVAAPLLAAASITLLGVIGADGDKFRLPGPTLLVLAVATISLVGSIQYGFHARALLYSADELHQWWGDDFDEAQARLQETQRDHYDLWKAKIGRAVLAYNVGITVLGGGVALCVLPPAYTDTTTAVTRWTAFGLVTTATVAELLWTVLARRIPYGSIRRPERERS